MTDTIQTNPEPEACLASRTHVDSNDPVIAELGKNATDGLKRDVAKAITLFLAVRDGVPYTSYRPYRRR